MHVRGENPVPLNTYSVTPPATGSFVQPSRSSWLLPPTPQLQVSPGSMHDANHMVMDLSPAAASPAAAIDRNAWRGDAEKPAGLGCESISNGGTGTLMVSTPTKNAAYQVYSPIAAQAPVLADGRGPLSPKPAFPLSSGFASPVSASGPWTTGGEVLTSCSSHEASCHFAIVKARRIVSFFRKQLQSILEGTERFAADATVLQRVRDLADALDAEVESAASAVGAGGAADASPEAVSTPTRTLPSPPFAGLLADSSVSQVHKSHSAGSETSGNGNELRQQEFTLALNAAKEANRELIELKELARQQAEEIKSLTRLRRADSERMEDLERTHRLEDSLREKDLKRRLAAAEESADARCQGIRRALQQKQRETLSRLDQVRRDCSRLRMDHLEQKRSVQLLSEALQQALAGAEKDIASRLEVFSKRQWELRTTTHSVASSVVQELEASVAEERELRVSEASSWSHRHALLSAERDDLQARLAMDLGQLAEQLRVAENRLAIECAAWTQERAVLVMEHGQARHGFVDCEATLERLRHDWAEREALQATSHESSLAALSASCEKERRTRVDLATEFAELQQRLFSTEEDLSVAMTSRETLYGKLEAQQRALVDTNEQALQACRQDYERRLRAVTEAEAAAEAVASQNLQAAEARATETEVALERSRSQTTAAAEGAAALREEAGGSRAEAARASGALQVMEGELASIKRELIEERTNSKSLIEQLESEKTALEEDARDMQRRISELTRGQVDNDARCTRLSEALEKGLRERDAQMAACEQRVMASMDAAANATAEAKYESQRVIDVQAALAKATSEATIERRTLEEDKHRLEEALASEAGVAWESQEQYCRWRESHLESLQQTQALVKSFSEAQVQAQTRGHEENLLQVAARERDRHLCRAELAASGQKLADVEARLGAVEYESCSASNLLSESQSSLFALQAQSQKHEKEAAAAQDLVQQKVKDAVAAADSAREREASLARRLEETAVEHKEERNRLERELNELKQLGSLQAMAKERMQAEHEARIVALEARQKTELQAERLGVETVLRENEQLRRSIAAQRMSETSGMDSLQAQLETHIAQLQMHTTELSPAEPRLGKFSPRPLSPASTTVRNLLLEGAGVATSPSRSRQLSLNS